MDEYKVVAVDKWACPCCLGLYEVEVMHCSCGKHIQLEGMSWPDCECGMTPMQIWEWMDENCEVGFGMPTLH